MNKLHPIPVNKTAANVIKKGVLFESNKNCVIRSNPNKMPIGRVPNDVEDLTGRQHGYFKVIGIYNDPDRYKNIHVKLRKAGGALCHLKRRKDMRQRSLWVVRCCCGNYEVRRAKAIKNRFDPIYDRCSECFELFHLKKKNFFISYGRWPSKDEEVKLAN